MKLKEEPEANDSYEWSAEWADIEQEILALVADNRREDAMAVAMAAGLVEVYYHISMGGPDRGIPQRLRANLANLSRSHSKYG